MSEAFSLEPVRNQLAAAQLILQHYLGHKLLAVYLYGSALDGGLKPDSDLDLLVSLSAPLDKATRRALMLELLNLSAPPGGGGLRPLEVTLVVQHEVNPWRYPARRELQFGEWLRVDLLAGQFEGPLLDPVPDPDLAILLTKAQQQSLALFGPPAAELFVDVPQRDFFQALLDTLALWNAEPDWRGDERNIVLTLARIWYSVLSGQIVSKDRAANWALERLPSDLQPLMQAARDAYMGAADEPALYTAKMGELVTWIKAQITSITSIPTA